MALLLFLWYLIITEFTLSGNGYNYAYCFATFCCDQEDEEWVYLNKKRGQWPLLRISINYKYYRILITLMNCRAFIAWNPISHSNHLEALLGLCGCL